jgi:hypothetical protein
MRRKKPWIVDRAPDTTLIVNGVQRVFGRRLSGFSYRDVITTTVGKGLQLDATFDLLDDGSA